MEGGPLRVSSREEWLGLAGEGRIAAMLLTGIVVCSVPARSWRLQSFMREGGVIMSGAEHVTRVLGQLPEAEVSGRH